MGGLPTLVASSTRNNCSFCAGFSTRACDRATAENQLDRASPLNSPPHKSWPVVKFATVTSTWSYKHTHKNVNNKSQYVVFKCSTDQRYSDFILQYNNRNSTVNQNLLSHRRNVTRVRNNVKIILLVPLLFKKSDS